MKSLIIHPDKFLVEAVRQMSKGGHDVRLYEVEQVSDLIQAEKALLSEPTSFASVGLFVTISERENTKSQLRSLFRLFDSSRFPAPPFVILFPVGFVDLEWERDLSVDFPLLRRGLSADPLIVTAKLSRVHEDYAEYYLNWPEMPFVHRGLIGTECKPGEEISAVLMRNRRNRIKPDWHTFMGLMERIIMQYLATQLKDWASTADVLKGLNKWDFAIHYGENTKNYFKEFHEPRSSFAVQAKRAYLKIEKTDRLSGLNRGVDRIFGIQREGKETYYRLWVRPVFIHPELLHNPKKMRSSIIQN
jgi:hypothetical protein